MIMLDPASKMALGAALAAFLGFIAGWLLHRLRRGRTTAPRERSMAEPRAEARHDLVVAQERDRSLASSARAAELGHGQRISRLEQDLGARSAQVAALREETARLAKLRHALETKLARSQEELAGRSEELVAALGRIKAQEATPRPAPPETRHTDDRLPEHLQALEGKLRQAAENAGETAIAHAAALREEQSARHRLQIRLAELEPLAVRVRDLELQLGDTERRRSDTIHDLEVETRRLKARNAELEPILRQRDDLERALQTGEEELRRRTARIEELGALIPEHHRRVALEAEVAALRSLLADRDREVDDLRSTGGRSPLARPSLPGIAELSRRRHHRRPADRDDLQRIHGIGPVLERRLNRLGINRFGQIARWTGDDIDRIAAKLEDSPDRIRRDRWVHSARREHTRKYGHDPVTGAAAVEQA